MYEIRKFRELDEAGGGVHYNGFDDGLTPTMREHWREQVERQIKEKAEWERTHKFTMFMREHGIFVIIILIVVVLLGVAIHGIRAKEKMLNPPQILEPTINIKHA